jgi:hypothetical protein
MVLRIVVYPMQWMGLVMKFCGMAVKRMVILAVSVRKMKRQSVKMEIAALIGKGR